MDESNRLGISDKNTHVKKRFWRGPSAQDSRSTLATRSLPVLAFRPDLEHDRFWEVPIRAETRPYFVTSLLECMGNWQACYAWRHLGSWPQSAVPENQRRRPTANAGRARITTWHECSRWVSKRRIRQTRDLGSL